VSGQHRVPDGALLPTSLGTGDDDDDDDDDDEAVVMVKLVGIFLSHSLLASCFRF
jgi:hypothetical protein